MIDTPLIRYSIADPTNFVSKVSDEWSSYLPLERDPGIQSEHSVKLSDYFMAAESFLKENDYEVIRNAAVSTRLNPISSLSIKDVNICLVKHGRFYHPSKIVVQLKNNQLFSLTLNVAFSTEGIACVDRECRALISLYNRIDYVPKVFGKNSYILKNGLEYSIFSTQWFDNYHEFHLSIDKEGKQRIIVWHSEKGNYYLSEDASYSLYRKIARILTCCYDPFSGNQIQPWHHAAGDFIINNDNSDVDVRLITVRQYTSLFQELPDDDDTLAEAAIIFLIGMSLRTRIDRADGVGEILWADSYAVQATAQGFFEGLFSNTPTSDQETSLKKKIIDLSLEMTPDDLLDYSRMIIESYNPLSPDLPIIENNIENHARDLHQAFYRIFR